MPLLSISQVSPKCRLAIWRVTEIPEDLVDAYPQLDMAFRDVSSRFRSLRRRQEYLAVRALLIEMSAGQLPAVRYDDNGRPWLDDGRRVSFSHTDGYAGVMMSDCEEVGLDIEYRSDRVAKVAHMFLRDDEPASTVEAMLVMWSAKEAVYKLFSPQCLAFHEMRIHPFVPQAEGKLTVENLKSNVTVVVDYCLTDDYVLTMCRL